MHKDHHSNSPRKRRKWLWCLLGSPFLIIVAFYLHVDGREFTLFVNPLPRDEKMIAHFQTHRDEFEALVKNYQRYIPTVEKPVFENRENKMLMKKAAISRLRSAGATWFPNPYSMEAAKQFEALSKQAGIKVLQFVHPYKSIGFDMEEYPLGKSNRNVLLFWTGAELIFEHMSEIRGNNFLLLIFAFTHGVSKEYLYIPEITKIEDGRLWYPITTSGNLKWSYRVFSSLNSYPPDWKVGECVYRQFESHWFIRMCITN
jgi:hypothetical protein